MHEVEHFLGFAESLISGWYLDNCRLLGGVSRSKGIVPQHRNCQVDASIFADRRRICFSQNGDPQLFENNGVLGTAGAGELVILRVAFGTEGFFPLIRHDRIYGLFVPLVRMYS
jgi:hypothetical protein